MESDAEFVERILADFETFGFDGLDIERMRALARRGAAMQEPWPEGFFQIGRLITERCATEGCGQTPSMRLEINDTGSYYCEPCARKIARIVTKYPPPRRKEQRMSDIVARLHAMIDANYGDVAADSVYGSAMSDAAAEIERLRALLKEAGEEPITSAEILARPTIPGVVDRNGGGRSA